jgi:uroporphyrinogen-III decarboxylase
VIENFGGTSFGDVNTEPASALRDPKGIREIAEWYTSMHTRRPNNHKVFEGQCEIALKNLEKLATRVGEHVHVIMLCGTDFRTQTSSFCSVANFRELWVLYYRRINAWVRRHTNWRAFKHSCGSVERFIDAFLQCGFDILNPVECSAAGMDAKYLKDKYGDRLDFWGGCVDPQQVLHFGTTAEARGQVLRRCEIFARGRGFVFNAIHNVQAETPVANVEATIDAAHKFAGIPV